MARLKSRSVVALLAALATSNALAQPVTLNVTSGTASVTSQTQSGGAWTVLIHVTAGSPAIFTVTTATSNVVVEQIEVECDADCVMTIDESGSGTFAEIRSVVEKSTSSPESFEIFRIQASGTLGPGEVAAEVIDEINIGGDLTATVTAGPRADNSDSDISLIDIGGDFYHANIRAIYGAIGQIIVGGAIEGHITGSPPRASQIFARDGIREIEADEMIDTSVWANYTELTAPLETGTMSRFELRTGGCNADAAVTAYSLEENALVSNPGIVIPGDVDCCLWFQNTVTCPIEIEGDLNGSIFVPGGGLDIGEETRGDITIHGNVGPDGWISCTGWNSLPGFIRTLVRIGGDFGGVSGTAFIYADALVDSGAAGQIIINAANVDGEWLGDVDIDTTTLSPVPEYTQTGLVGAVGEVPFHLHDEDCLPANGGAITPGAFSVTLYFYGPVTWDSGFPFNIFWCPEGIECNPTADNDHWEVAGGQGTRSITLVYVDETDPDEIPPDRHYHIVPVLTGSNALLCDKLLTTSDVPVANFTYVFDSP